MSHRVASVLLVLAACAKDLPPEQPCLEARTAIAARADDCTGDSAISGALLDAFDDRTTCVVEDALETSALARDPLLAYECALATRNIACELALEYGDDLDAWLATVPTCTAILEVGP